MTKKEAAKMLAVTERTINNYISKGYLTKELTEDEVKRLTVVDKVKIPFNRVSFINLFLKVETQEKELEVIKRILNMYKEPLNLSDSTLSSLYTLADISKKDLWPKDWLVEWTNVICRLSEKEFMKLSELHNDPHPWLRFLTLVNYVLSQNISESINLLYTHTKASLLQQANIWTQIKGSSKEVAEVIHSEPFSKNLIANLLAITSEKIH